MADTLWFHRARLAEGWADNVRITVDDGRIVRIDTDAPANSGDALFATGIPGVPNLHSHAFQRAMAGLTERRGAGEDSFWSWRTLMYRFVERLTPDDVEAIAALAYVEMLESGFTRVGEFHYLHNDRDGAAFADPAEMAGRIVAAAELTGIGLTLLPVFYAHGGFGGAKLSRQQLRFAKDLDAYADLLDASRRVARGLADAVVGVAPHSLRAATPEEIRRVVEMAGASPIHIHIAEQVGEVEDCLSALGSRPVRWLLDNLDVDARWCLIHATHLDLSELKDLAQSAAVVGLCPITEANLGDGVFPAADFLRAGGRFGVGSDSNVRIDAAEELRLLEYGQRLTRLSRNVLADGPLASTGATLFARAVEGGAQALGVEGGLAVGASADLVSLADDGQALARRAEEFALDRWVFAGGRECVDAVWRRGRMVVRDGVHVQGPAIRARYAKVITRLLS